MLPGAAPIPRRQALATALFSRTDVQDFERMEYELTPEAIELGLDAALPAVFEIGKERESGRVDRRQAARTDLNVPGPLPLEIALTGTERWISTPPARNVKLDETPRSVWWSSQ